MKKLYIIGIGAMVFLVTLIILSNIGGSEMMKPSIYDKEIKSVEEYTGDWRALTLKDIQTGEEYTIGSLSDRPILLESFAVWCPSCTRQQKEIQKLEDTEFGKEFYSISLNTDQNENKEKILEHIETNKFTGIYSISNKEFTDSLIKEFSLSIVNAPSSPVVLICNGDQKTYYLDSGLKTSSELKESIESLC